MGRWGSVDFSGLKKFQEELAQIEAENDEFIRACAKELTARLLREVIRNTPTGQYPDQPGKQGGTLKRGWTTETAEEAADGKRISAAAYVRSLKIIDKGSYIEVEIINPVDYSSYVEYGHRTVDHKGWVDGQYMMTMAKVDLEQRAPALLEKKLRKHLEGMTK